MKLSDLKNTGHWPTLLAAFLYFDFSFMVWAVLGPLGPQIGETLRLSPEQKGLMVALPITAFITNTVRPGQVFIPMHYSAANALTFPAFDPYSRQPAYKACAVSVAGTR